MRPASFPGRQRRLLARPLLLALALGVCLACAPSTDREPESEEPVGESTLDPQELTRLEERFQEALDRAWKEAQESDEILPGATAAFILPDGHVSTFATGFSDVEKEIPMTPDMRMPSGSIGKTYVSAVVLSLAQEGALDLDDPISTYLGEEEWFDRLPNGPEITVRMLMNHSSGLIDHVFDSEEFPRAAAERLGEGDPDDHFTPRELVEFVLDTEPLFPPGQGFNYTDTGYILLGMVIEKATGSTYYEELERRFLEPLGLSGTVPQDRRQVPRLAQGYAVTSHELFGLDEKIVDEKGALKIHPLTEWTGGGLYNNPRDLVIWAKRLYEGQAMEGDYLQELVAGIALPSDAEEPVAQEYGLGVRISKTELGPALGHSGFFPGYNSRMAYFPELEFALAIQINTDRSDIQRHFMELAILVAGALEESATSREAA